MISRKQLGQIFDECYTELFKYAVPSADYAELKKSNRKKRLKKGWYLAYYLDDYKQVKIIKEICLKHGIKKKWEVESIVNAIFLGHAPSGVKRDTNCLVCAEGVIRK